MDDVLVFGGVFDGAKRSIANKDQKTAIFPGRIRGSSPFEQIPAYPIDEFRIMTFWSKVDGKEYLIAVNGDTPSDEVILDRIDREKPEPIS